MMSLFQWVMMTGRIVISHLIKNM